MKWFKRYSVCTECHVHFEPVTGLFADLCYTHRKPELELHARKQAVILWATSRWEQLEDQMKMEKAADRAAWQAANQDLLKSMAAQQSASMNAYAGTHYAASQQSMGAGMFGNLGGIRGAA